jgi:hypothetical protein
VAKKTNIYYSLNKKLIIKNIDKKNINIEIEKLKKNTTVDFYFYQIVFILDRSDNTDVADWLFSAKPDKK